MSTIPLTRIKRIYTAQFPGEEKKYKIVVGNDTTEKHHIVTQNAFEAYKNLIEDLEGPTQTTGAKTKIVREIWTRKI